MKKFFTILLAGLAVHQVQSQTITSANLPIIGEAWIEFIDATGGLVTITAGGAGQTWNYGTSFNVADTSAFLFESLNNAPAIMNASINFPDANLTVNEFIEDTSLSVYIYSTDFYKTNATGLYIDGLGFAAPPGYWLKRDYNPDLLIIPVPFALNDTRANNALYQQQYTVDLGPPVGLVTENHKSYTIQDFVADATGTLTTPLGTFNNVLRIKEFSYYIDSTIYSVPSIPTEVSISDTTITYQFVQTNSHCLLMSARIDPITNQTIGASYYDPIFTGVEEENNSFSVTFYPNPVGEEFYLNHIKANSTIQIFDIAGKLIKDQYLGGLESNVKVNTSDMPAGFYFFSISNPKNGNYFNGKFEVVK